MYNKILVPLDGSARAEAILPHVVELASRFQSTVILIAIASHGRTGAACVFYGCVAAGVLHRVDRPLLINRSQSGE
jgi:nucleotide-binding universal stress UspA family protein